MTPLLGRASGGGLRDWLPTLDSHQFSSQHTQNMLTHMHVHTILWYLRRVNHFLRPWAAGPARAKMVLEHSNRSSVSSSQSVCICLCVSSCLFFLLFFNPQALIPISVFNTMTSLLLLIQLHSRKNEKLQPRDKQCLNRESTDRELNGPARLNAPLYSCTVLSSFSLSLSCSPQWPPPLRL